jgi:hypothetical protein
MATARPVAPAAKLPAATQVAAKPPAVATKTAAPATSAAKPATPAPVVLKPHPVAPPHGTGPSVLPAKPAPVRSGPRPATGTVRIYQAIKNPPEGGAKSKNLGSINVPLKGASPTSDHAKSLVAAAVADFVKVHVRDVQVNHAVGGGYVANVAAPQ